MLNISGESRDLMVYSIGDGIILGHDMSNLYEEASDINSLIEQTNGKKVIIIGQTFYCEFPVKGGWSLFVNFMFLVQIFYETQNLFLFLICINSLKVPVIILLL